MIDLSAYYPWCQNFSKEQCKSKQINDFTISTLSLYLCSYRKGFNTQKALLTHVENWRKISWNGKMEIGRNLNFDGHVFSLRHKAGRKLVVLARLSKFTSFRQKRILMKTFVESQFGNCPLIWVFHIRNVNSKINNLQERSLRIVYDDYVTSFEDLLKKGNSFNIHHRNI